MILAFSAWSSLASGSSAAIKTARGEDNNARAQGHALLFSAGQIGHAPLRQWLDRQNFADMLKTEHRSRARTGFLPVKKILATDKCGNKARSCGT